MSRTRVAIVTLLWVIAAGCSSSDDPPLTDAVALACPTPGDLPFRLSSHGFHGKNAQLAMMDPVFKDEASDTLGNPNGGQVASVYTDDADGPKGGAGDAFSGGKARTGATEGLFSSPMPGENVSLWTYDGGAWAMLARGQTDTEGRYAFDATGATPANDQPVYAMLEADGSCAKHYDALYAPNTQVVVTDIDGTLTTNDQEFIMQLGDESYTPKMMTAANTVMQTWAMKGYPIVYLTARPHAMRAESRAWLEGDMFPTGALVTTNGMTSDAGDYKTIWLKRMVDKFGWNIVAAYGNATTDITAYANAKIPLDHTFIVGPNGGMGGTVNIPNMDFTDHLHTYVDAQPNAPAAP